MGRLLRSPGRAFRAMRRNRPATLDWSIAGVLALTLLLSRLPDGTGDTLWTLPLQLVACLALRWRRTRPMTVLVLVVVIYGLCIAVGVREDTLGAVTLVATYSTFGYGPRRQAIFGLLATSLTLFVASLSPAAALSNSHVTEGLILAVAGLIGDNRRTRRAYVAGVEERAARLEREREVQARIAAAEERTRIARELHDVVAHSLAVMVAQADGASYVVDNDPAQARRAIETVAATGRSALAEMHRLLGILRADQEDDLAPQPGIDQLDSLIARTQSAGLPVTLSVEGAPVTLSQGLSLTVYRIVQEALTNTLKHAGPSVSARVQVRYDDGAVEIDVDDDGAATHYRNDASPPPAGHGLTGMRERTAVYGGSLQAGPRSGHGWRIHARLPLESHS